MSEPAAELDNATLLPDPQLSRQLYEQRYLLCQLLPLSVSSLLLALLGLTHYHFASRDSSIAFYIALAWLAAAYALPAALRSFGRDLFYRRLPLLIPDLREQEKLNQLKPRADSKPRELQLLLVDAGAVALLEVPAAWHSSLYISRFALRHLKLPALQQLISHEQAEVMERRNILAPGLGESQIPFIAVVLASVNAPNAPHIPFLFAFAALLLPVGLFAAYMKELSFAIRADHKLSQNMNEEELRDYMQNFVGFHYHLDLAYFRHHLRWRLLSLGMPRSEVKVLLRSFLSERNSARSTIK